jgi:hypothetical protein
MATPFEINVQGASDLVENDTNKIPTDGEGGAEGQTGERIDNLTLDMSDAELLAIRDELEKNYGPHEAKMKDIWEQNMESYLGKRKTGQWLNGGEPRGANLQFEAEETFLAAALSKNPEPVVWTENSEEGNAIAKAVKTMLQFHADQLVLRRKLAFMVRQWSIYHLGVLKYGWNEVEDITDGSDIGDVDVTNRRIQNFVFDPNGYVDAYGHFVGALGERIEVTAQELSDLFPKHKDYISEQVEGKMGTKVTYTEWWSADDTFCFYTFKKVVLDKHKNQYFNYPEPVLDPVTGMEVMDPETVEIDPETLEPVEDTGEPLMQPGINHFARPKKPYTFLSVFSLQEQPHDITGLIEQNIANQKKIAARSEQIDRNVDASNNGYAYSENNFNQETAKQASEARRKGNPILIPSGGPIQEAILPLPAQDLPNGIFNELEITKNDLRSSWGIVGITSTTDDDDNTVRGEIIEQANDTSRIGGGIGDAIEQVADSCFNWLTQLYSVFYDEEHFAAVMGNAKAVEYVSFSNSKLDRQLIVSVAPDSLKPKDEVTEINMAQALFDKGAIGPKTLLKILDFPDPEEAAADGVLYQADPMAYLQLNFPELLQQMQQAQAEQQQMQMMGMPTAGMSADGMGGMPPEAVTEPPGDLSRGPVDTQLSQIQMPSIPQGGPAG